MGSQERGWPRWRQQAWLTEGEGRCACEKRERLCVCVCVCNVSCPIQREQRLAKTRLGSLLRISETRSALPRRGIPTVSRGLSPSGDALLVRASSRPALPCLLTTSSSRSLEAPSPLRWSIATTARDSGTGRRRTAEGTFTSVVSLMICRFDRLLG